MARRNGFKRFIRSIEGYSPEVDAGPLPKSMTHHKHIRNKSIAPGQLEWVEYAFQWSTTKQGHRFWGNISIGQGDQELACEILREWRRQLENRDTRY